MQQGRRDTAGRTTASPEQANSVQGEAGRSRTKASRTRASSNAAQADSQESIPTGSSESANGSQQAREQAFREDFCDSLIAARERRGMSLDEIADVTRIPLRSLERLESGEFERLPADVFVRGFLRSYARCVGLDADETIRRYAECGMTPAPVASPMADELASSMATLDESVVSTVRARPAGPRTRRPTTSSGGSRTTPELAVEQEAETSTRPRTPSALPPGSGPKLLVSQPAPDTTGSMDVPASAPSNAATTEPRTGQKTILQPGEATERSAGDTGTSAAPDSAAPVAAVQQVQEAGSGATNAAPAPHKAKTRGNGGRGSKRKKRRKKRRQRTRNETAAATSAETTSAETAHAAAAPATDMADAVTAPDPTAVDASPDASSNKQQAIATRKSDEHGLANDTQTASTGSPAGEATASSLRDAEGSDTEGSDTEQSAAKHADPAPQATGSGELASRTGVHEVLIRPDDSRPDDSEVADVKSQNSNEVRPRPSLIIDDDCPEVAALVQETREAEKLENEEQTWRNFLPPSLLDTETGSRRGALTLAVIILVIVATLTMSYLLRRPSISGDGVTLGPSGTSPGMSLETTHGASSHSQGPDTPASDPTS